MISLYHKDSALGTSAHASLLGNSRCLQQVGNDCHTSLPTCTAVQPMEMLQVGCLASFQLAIGIKACKGKANALYISRRKMDQHHVNEEWIICSKEDSVIPRDGQRMCE
jgi:hypothetical protein